MRQIFAMSIALALAACGNQPDNSSANASSTKSDGNSTANDELQPAAPTLEQRLARYSAFKLSQREIDRRYTPSYQPCLDRSAGGSGGVECAANEIKTQDGRLNAAYQRLVEDVAGSPGEAQLRKSERGWIAGRDKACREDGDGTMYREVEAGCIVDETIRRAEFLRGLSTKPMAASPALHTPALVSAGVEAAATGQRKAWKVGEQKGYAIPGAVTKLKAGSCRKVSFTLMDEPAQPPFGTLKFCGNLNGEWSEGEEPSQDSGLDADADQD